MRICQKHWDALREAVRTRGMWPLVSQDGRAAAERMVEEVQGTATEATYDPLMAAHNMIVTAVIDAGAMYVMTGDYCPVCEAVKHCPTGQPDGYRDKEHIEDDWINGPADAVLAHVRETPVLVAMLAAPTQQEDR